MEFGVTHSRSECALGKWSEICLTSKCQWSEVSAWCMEGALVLQDLQVPRRYFCLQAANKMLWLSIRENCIVFLGGLLPQYLLLACVLVRVQT